MCQRQSVIKKNPSVPTYLECFAGRSFVSSVFTVCTFSFETKNQVHDQITDFCFSALSVVYQLW